MKNGQEFKYMTKFKDVYVNTPYIIKQNELLNIGLKYQTNTNLKISVKYSKFKIYASKYRNARHRVIIYYFV
jgi:hypothetical protein